MMTGNLNKYPFTGSIDGFVNNLIGTASCKYIDEEHKSATHKEQVRTCVGFMCSGT